MKTTVFIHTNNKQMIGAKVASYALKSRARFPERFEVHILSLEETPHLNKRGGHTYLRKGKEAVWRNEDLQSFSPLRMMVPQAMNFQGRALVIDPDVFAVGDVGELLESDMQGKSIICRNITEGYKSNGNSFYATSVMLLDCERLQHWKWDRQVDDMFSKRLDYGDWISLRLERPEVIGDLPEEWNHFDTLNEKTKLVHNTERSTQPWKTGLPVDFDTTTKGWRGRFMSIFKPQPRYLPHPDPNQEMLVFRLLKECLDCGVIDERFIREEIAKSHVRHDILEKLGTI